jgi:formylglycine-generating enzyme required for sulfatase activity
VHEVSFTFDFWMDTTEVTQAEYKSIAGNIYSMFLGDNNPVDVIGFEVAARYCNAKSRKNGLEEVYDTVTWTIDYSKNGYRLPTEAEWEYACRAGTTTDTYWGTGNVDDYGWSRNNRDAFSTRPVAQKLPNAFGLYDMNGNVWEYCNDLYSHQYTAGPQTDPAGPATGEYHVMRGGCIDSNLEILTSTVRVNPYIPDKEYGRIGWGFRVVLPVK